MHAVLGLKTQTSNHRSAVGRDLLRWAVLSMIFPLMILQGDSIPMQSAPPSKYPIRVEMVKSKDSAVIHPADSGAELQTLLEIRSESGIGECVIHREANRWPDRMVLRFALRGMEQIVFRIGNRKWQGAVSSTDGEVRWSMQQADQPEQTIDPSHLDWCPIRVVDATAAGPVRVPLEDAEQWEITVPKRWLNENPESIRVTWIDFYR
jgi:hypothetical protein